ncbi:glycosyltransferase involved in cell wall biosynthesis [Pedobacter sp. AK013]|uniref:glycosyltransferase family 4 protein n=1 Tax=Pedobacter sp. AK013 TaxID=2723071 RepID=UPI0016098847|nr:glycosyltransferase family 4 protein [Pedobacter sp. AK013]MBB6235493.1 glycosyltransferase involved in cell wall biosynthesis [Pedobacter sp. AK013]
MRIAYISYEHPLGIAGGGIGTYIGQISRLMASRGHEIEVFSGHIDENQTLNIDGYILHLIKSGNSSEFRENVLAKFIDRHEAKLFEVIESPEYGADALLIKKKFPSLPLAVKLHTPSFLVSLLNNYNGTFLKKLRFIIGGLIRGKLVRPYWIYNKENDPEYQLFILANSVCSPSNSLKKIVNGTWGNRAISVIPNLFIPSIELTPGIKKNDAPLTVTFIGKLERRKGILDLIKAIPMILKEEQEIQFMFVGAPLGSPIKGLKMDEYINLKLKKQLNHIKFKGFVPYQDMDKVFKETDICILPSLWENFPTVCLEAMSAGIPVIGTSNGGMADIIENDKTGVLIHQNSPTEITQAIIKLKRDYKLREEIAVNGHKHILENYNGDTLGKIIEGFYDKTIAAH